MSQAIKLWQQWQAQQQRAKLERTGFNYSAPSIDRQVAMEHALAEERRIKADQYRKARRKAFIAAARKASRGKHG